MRKADANIQVENKNINSPMLLEHAIKNSNIVVYFTHDYFSMTVEKNKQLKSTAEICKAYNVDKLIAVSPIEFINYYNSDGFTDNPIEDETKTHDEVLKIFPKTSILRSNLTFGTSSYFTRFLTQNWMNNFSHFDATHFKNFRFNPM
jgi:hypothetical protein